jgi:hypothetical protein
MAFMQDIQPTEAHRAAGGYVVLGRAGHVFTEADEMLLELVVMPQLIEKGVNVKKIHIEMRDGDSTHLRLTVGTEEAKRKLLAIGRLDYTDQIAIIFSDTVAVTYPVAVKVRESEYDNEPRPVPGKLVAPASLTSLRLLAACIKEHFGLRCLPVFTKDRVALAEELDLTLNCGSPEDANTLLHVPPYYDCRQYSFGGGSHHWGPWLNSVLSFYQPDLQAVVTDKDASAKLDPTLGEVAIERATDVSVSVVEAAWVSGQALVTAKGTRDYDVLVHGEKRILAGQQLTFAPRLYLVLVRREERLRW